MWRRSHGQRRDHGGRTSRCTREYTEGYPAPSAARARRRGELGPQREREIHDDHGAEALARRARLQTPWPRPRAPRCSRRARRGGRGAARERRWRAPRAPPGASTRSSESKVRPTAERRMAGATAGVRLGVPRGTAGCTSGPPRAEAHGTSTHLRTPGGEDHFPTLPDETARIAHARRTSSRALPCRDRAGRGGRASEELRDGTPQTAGETPAAGTRARPQARPSAAGTFAKRRARTLCCRA